MEGDSGTGVGGKWRRMDKKEKEEDNEEEVEEEENWKARYRLNCRDGSPCPCEVNFTSLIFKWWRGRRGGGKKKKRIYFSLLYMYKISPNEPGGFVETH